MKIFIIAAVSFYVGAFLGYIKGVDKERKRQETIDQLAETFRILDRLKQQHENEK